MSSLSNLSTIYSNSKLDLHPRPTRATRARIQSNRVWVEWLTELFASNWQLAPDFTRILLTIASSFTAKDANKNWVFQIKYHVNFSLLEAAYRWAELIGKFCSWDCWYLHGGREGVHWWLKNEEEEDDDDVMGSRFPVDMDERSAFVRILSYGQPCCYFPFVKHQQTNGEFLKRKKKRKLKRKRGIIYNLHGWLSHDYFSTLVIFIIEKSNYCLYSFVLL
mgnify:CR=1 FL=1